MACNYFTADFIWCELCTNHAMVLKPLFGDCFGYELVLVRLQHCAASVCFHVIIWILVVSVQGQRCNDAVFEATTPKLVKTPQKISCPNANAHTISASAESMFPTLAPATAQPDATCKTYFALELTHNALHTQA